MALKVINIDTPTLGDRSYLVHDGSTAVIVDPQRDIDRLDDLLVKEGVKLGAVAETHIHNDYVSGGLEISRSHDVQYLISKNDLVSFQHQSVSNQEVISVGTFALKAKETPGHTFTHMSYELINSSADTVGVFTGGSLLHGSTGRPDLLGWDNASELAEMQHNSAHKLGESLSDGVNVYPTHGFGSFCSATPTLTDSSTIADEKKSNPVFLKDLQSYVASTLAALDIYPSYFKLMNSANSTGPANVDLSKLRDFNSDEIVSAINSGAWVVDLRNRELWAAEHLFGSVSLGIDGSLASYLGWLFPYEKDLILFSDNPGDISKAQRELVRIGIDRPTGTFVGPLSSYSDVNSIKVVKFRDVAKAMRSSEVTLLDVRQVNERKKSHIEGSVFIPFYEVQSRVEELPKSEEIWVHCASGYRAASILCYIESSGRTPVLINDDYELANRVEDLKIIS